MRNLLFYFIVILLFQPTFLSAQSQKSLFENLSDDQRKSIEALALYPEDVRLAILHVAQHPGLLAKTKRLQDISIEKFRDIIVGLPQETQEAIWDLTRYDGLVDRLADNKSVDEVLKDYPTIIHQRAKQLSINERDVIENIAELNVLSKAMENEIYQDEAADLQNSFKILLDNPDVLTILLEEIELTILVGDLYTSDPEWVLYKADSLHHELARQNAKELADWRAAVEKDPQTEEELYTSMSEYQEAYPYDDLYAEYEDWDQYTEGNADQIIREIPIYYYYPYSFWYGYPYWYDYPRWRVFPYWYDWGLFPQFHSHSVIISLPRYHIVTWYFNRPQHHIRHNHLSTKFIDHYQGHRSFGSSISSGVKSWQQANRTIITDDFLADRNKLAANLRKYGAMENERTVYNRKHPEKELDAAAYVMKKNQKYRTLVPKTTVRNEKSQTKLPDDMRRPVVRPGQEKESRKAPPIKTKEQIRTIDKAKEYHRDQWTRKAPDKATESKSSPRQKTVKPEPQKTKRTPVPKKSPVKRKTDAE